MFNSFTEEARKILVEAKVEMKNLKHPYVGSEHLLLAILKGKNSVSKKLKEYGIDYKTFKDELINIVGIGSKENEFYLYTPLLKRVMENAMIDSRENNNGVVTIEHLFSSLIEEGEGVAIRILLSLDIDLDLLYQDFAYKIVNTKKKNKKLLVEELGNDLTKMAMNGEFDPVVGRDEEIKMVLEILSRRKKNNPILVGEAGVGKTAIVEELSRLIAIGEVPNSLKNKRIISMDMATAVAGTKYRGEFEERINKVLKEVEENDDIILFIDEIHTLVGAGGAEGAIDASNIFKPALARNKLRCIGATTTMEYKKFIEEDKALDRRFQQVKIDIPSDETVKEILLKLKSTYENYHKVIIDNNLIDLIIELSNKYIYNRNQPDKAIDILDEVCAHVNLKENKKIKKYNLLNSELKTIVSSKNAAIVSNDFTKASELKIKENKIMNQINNLELDLYKVSNYKKITKDDIIKIVSRKSNVPIYKYEKNSKFNNIEKDLNNKIKGQEKAIKDLSNIYKKIKLGFKDDNNCYSMLFVGPSGVGKTELAKIFGKKLINKNVIKLDMSEYSEPHSISKLIGSPAGYVGYNDNKNIFEKIKNNPFSVIILDEIERAHENILNLFFQILDEGKVLDSKGNNINFSNCIVIMTSNVGYNEASIGFNNNINNDKLKEYFSIPFINRIDNIIHFNKLSYENIKDLTNSKLNKLKNKYKQKQINVKINKKVVDEIINLSNYEEFGARKIDKIIKDRVENIIIDEIINNNTNINIKSCNEKILI